MKIATDYLSNIWDYDKFLQNYRTGILQMDGWVSLESLSHRKMQNRQKANAAGRWWMIETAVLQKRKVT